MTSAQFNAQLLAIAVTIVGVAIAYFVLLSPPSQFSSTTSREFTDGIHTTESKPALDPIKWQPYSLIEKTVVSPNTASYAPSLRPHKGRRQN